MIFVFSVRFTSLSMIMSRSIHVAANGIISFFLWQINIPLYIYIHNTFFIHSSVDEHLDGVHVLVIVNSTAMSIKVYASFQIRVFSRYMPRSRITGSVALILVFYRTSTLFLVAVPVCIITNSVGAFSERGFSFNTLFMIYCLQIFLDDGHHDEFDFDNSL